MCRQAGSSSWEWYLTRLCRGLKQTALQWIRSKPLQQLSKLEERTSTQLTADCSNFLEKRTIGIHKKSTHEQVQKNKSSCFLPAFIKHEAKALNVIQNIVPIASTHEVKRSSEKPVKYDCYSCNLQAMTAYFPDRWEKTASLTSGL